MRFEALDKSESMLSVDYNLFTPDVIELNEAAGMAAWVNRLAGHYAEPTPATQIMDIVRQIPAALAQILDQKENLWESRNA